MRTTPTPDIEGMVHGGETRLRRRNSMRIGLVAAAVLLVGGGIYGATQLGDDGDPDTSVANQPSETAGAAVTPPDWVDTDGAGGDIEPGTYRLFAGVSAGGAAIHADMTIDGDGWQGSNFPVVFDGDEQEAAGLGVYRPEGFPTRSGCHEDPLNNNVGTTPQAVVRQLASLPQSKIVVQPSPTQAFGREALHLRLRIVDHQCLSKGQAYTPAAGRGVSYAGGERPILIDFWVVDIDGTPVVVDLFRNTDTPRALVDQATRAKDSITFVEEE